MGNLNQWATFYYRSASNVRVFVNNMLCICWMLIRENASIANVSGLEGKTLSEVEPLAQCLKKVPANAWIIEENLSNSEFFTFGWGNSLIYGNIHEHCATFSV